MKPQFAATKRTAPRSGILLLILTAMLTSHHQPLLAQRPNIVLVMADDLGWGDLGCQGHKTLHTPHLDAMAADGVRFTRFHAAAPVCSPTRASCLTGKHPYRLDIRGANAGHLAASETTLQKLLRSAGYRTGHFGKWHLGTLTKTVRDSNRGGPRGAKHYAPPWLRDFDVCFSTEAKVPTHDPMKHPSTGQPYGTHYWNERGEIVRDNLAGDDSRVIMDRVLPFVRDCAKEQQPFLAVVWFHAPHLPCVASADDRARYGELDEEKQHYYGCITALDREVGRLRKTLQELEVADNTIVWFCSDNGPEGRTDKAPGSSGGLRGRKRSLYDGGTRVPSLLTWPKRIAAGRVVASLASTSDFVPTLAAWLDLELPEDPARDGIDLSPVLTPDTAGDAADRAQAIGFESARMATWTEQHFKLVAHLNNKPGKQRGIVRVELFDLRNEPAERTDVADAHPDRTIAMRSALAAWRAAIRKRP